MASPALLRQRVLLPALLAAGVALSPTSALHADGPDSPKKKSIYDDLPPPASLSPFARKPSTPSPSASPSPASTQPTVTDLLAQQIRSARLFLHAHVAAGEARVNASLTSLFALESSFTSTIASLAPPGSSNERVMPGAVYVLVAAMTGSIVTRNRNILLRASVPLAAGIGAGWVVIPVTMQNVADLIWRYEERVPVISENHLRVQGAAEQAWRMARERGGKAFEAVDKTVRRERSRAEEWVKKGN